MKRQLVYALVLLAHIDARTTCSEPLSSQPICLRMCLQTTGPLLMFSV